MSPLSVAYEKIAKPRLKKVESSFKGDVGDTILYFLIVSRLVVGFSIFAIPRSLEYVPGWKNSEIIL